MTPVDRRCRQLVVSRIVKQTSQAPAPLGPYSQIIVANGFVFCAGQTPVDPGTGELVIGDVSIQTRQCLLNLQAMLGEAGTSLANVVQMRVFLVNMEHDFAAMNSVYAELVPAPHPVRTTVGVARLPIDAKVEIDCVAVLG